MFIKSQRDYMPLFLEKVSEGNYLVPKFQRDFVWSCKQIIELFDSIIKGFPIGSIIMWKPEKDKFDTIKEVGGVPINAINSDSSYILDGRQRITSMMSVLYKKGIYSDYYYVDLDDYTVIRRTRGDRPPNLLKLSDAFDSWYIVEYIEHIRGILPDDKIKEYTDKAKLVNKKLLSYEIGYITVHGGKIDDAVEIFSRLNSKGLDISPDYMIQALTYNPRTGFLFSDKIKEIIEAIEPYHFGSIKRDTIMKCIYNYTSKAFIDAKTEDIISMPNLPNIVESVKMDIVLAAKFLHDECGVWDSSLLPYIYQFVMLSMFFKENKKPTALQKADLREWFYYTSYTGYFTNTSLANIRVDIQEFRKYSIGMSSKPMKHREKCVISEDIPSRLSLGSVRACSLLLSTILPPLKDKYVKIGFFYPGGIQKERTIGNAICYINKTQYNVLKDLFTQKKPWNASYEKFYLSEKCMKYYFLGEYDTFIALREKLILAAEKDNITSYTKDMKLV